MKRKKYARTSVQVAGLGHGKHTSHVTEMRSDPSYTVAAVARRIGVAPGTLRTWAHRYGIGPTSHEAGAHRRYSSADVARLESMQRFILSGLSPAESARLAMGDEQSPAASQDGAVVKPLPSAVTSDRAAKGLARAARALDSEACADIVRQSLSERGVIWTWDILVRPVLVDLGKRWESTGEGIEAEHLLSEVLVGCLAEVRLTADRAPTAMRPVLLACAPEDEHCLGLRVLAAALAERGIESRLLGSRTPRMAVEAAMSRTGPAVLVVSSQIACSGLEEYFEELAMPRPSPIVMAAGPGWPDVPVWVERPADLPHAVHRISNLLAG